MRMPEACAFQFFGQVVLVDKMSWEVVGIFIVGTIAQFFHQFGGCVAQMERHGEVASLVHVGKRLVNCEIGTITLLAGGEIDGTFAQRDASLGPAYLIDDVEGGIGEQQSIGIGEANIFSSEDAQAAGDELGVFSASD